MVSSIDNDSWGAPVTVPAMGSNDDYHLTQLKADSHPMVNETGGARDDVPEIPDNESSIPDLIASMLLLVEEDENSWEPVQENLKDSKESGLSAIPFASINQSLDPDPDESLSQDPCLSLTGENLGKVLELVDCYNHPSRKAPSEEALELTNRVSGFDWGNSGAKFSGSPFILVNIGQPHQLLIPVGSDDSRSFKVINLVVQPKSSSSNVLKGKETKERDDKKVCMHRGGMQRSLESGSKGKKGEVSSGCRATAQSRGAQQVLGSRLNSDSQELSVDRCMPAAAESSPKNMALLKSSLSSGTPLLADHVRDLNVQLKGENRGWWAQNGGLAGAVAMNMKGGHEELKGPVSRVMASHASEGDPSPRPLARFDPKISSVGDLFDDGHLFVKSNIGGLRWPKTSYGKPMRQLLYIHESELRHNLTSDSVQYQVNILSGTMGPADGFGFVLDKVLLRRNVQTTMSVFINSRGELCKRNLSKLTRISRRLPPLQRGFIVNIDVNLTRKQITFTAYSDLDNPLDNAINYRPKGPKNIDELPFLGSASCDFQDLSSALQSQRSFSSSSYCSGFFCAVLSEKVAISLY